ncbi:MAG TPA: DUF885 domain-containing protein [Gammaproteobacteria bacterium]|nr:DUF885 domain-containing protein [Gammaproteobacteria bacterium]
MHHIQPECLRSPIFCFSGCGGDQTGSTPREEDLSVGNNRWDAQRVRLSLNGGAYCLEGSNRDVPVHDRRSSVPVTNNIFLLADRYVDQLAALQPMLATQMGVPGFDGQWGVQDPSGWQDIGALFKRTLSAIEALPPSDRHREQLGRRVLKDHLSGRVERIEHGHPLQDLNNIASPVQGFRETFDLMPKVSADDWELIASRLSSLHGAVDGYIESLSEGRRRGLAAARRQVEACIEQCRVNSGSGSFFYQLSAGAHDAQVPDALQAEVDTGAAAARLAYAHLANYLEDEYLPDSVEADGVGLERYRRASRHFLLTEIDHEAVYHWAWQEVAALRAQMVEVGRQIDPALGFQEIVQLLKTGADYVVSSEAEFLSQMRQCQMDALDQLDGTVFDVPVPIKQIDVQIAPPGTTLGAYYIQPSEDFSRAGSVWYAKLTDTSVYPLFDEVTTAYHEGFPGHHLQIGVQMCLGDELTRAHRLAIWYDGYGEGWALYAERLMDELGFINRPEYRFGLLCSQLMRACRVVIDIGMHLGLIIPKDAVFHSGDIWTFDLAVEMLRDYGLMSPVGARSEVTRYLGWPAQAISYKVGEQFILDLRAQAEHEAWFTLKEFHRRILVSGPVGLDHLKELILGQE